MNLKTDGIVGTEFEFGAFAFFNLEAGLKLALYYPRRRLAHASGLAQGKPSAMEVSLGHSVSSKTEVDAVMEQAEQARAVIVKHAQQNSWGGDAGDFQVPDQHL